LPYRDQVVVGGMGEGCFGAVDRYLGMLASERGCWDAAEAHFETALRLETGLLAPPLLARTRHWYGRMLLTRGWAGDGDRATQLLDASAETAERLGMASLLGELRRLRARA